MSHGLIRYGEVMAFMYLGLRKGCDMRDDSVREEILAEWCNHKKKLK